MRVEALRFGVTFVASGRTGCPAFRPSPLPSPCPGEGVVFRMTKSHFILGRWSKGDGPTFVSTDPASGEVNWEGHAATAR